MWVAFVKTTLDCPIIGNAEVSSTVNTSFFTFLQGSAKLEKAEILQMTVDHLRHLHSRDPRGE